METIVDFSGVLDKDGRFVSVDVPTTILDLIAYSEKARRQGLLSLEDGFGALPTEYARWLLRLVLDGVDPGALLENEANVRKRLLSALRGVHETVLALAFDGAAGYTDDLLELHMKAKGLPPSFHPALAGMRGYFADPRGHAPAGGFPKGLEPFAAVLEAGLNAADKRTLAAELLGSWRSRCETYYELVTHGVMGIQSGDAPFLLTERLFAYVDVDVVDAVRARLEAND